MLQSASSPPHPPTRRRLWLRCCRLIGLWLDRRRQRRDLGELDQRLLDDIGVSAADAARERDKPFWR